jgi:hypothetical protein
MSKTFLDVFEKPLQLLAFAIVVGGILVALYYGNSDFREWVLGLADKYAPTAPKIPGTK